MDKSKQELIIRIICVALAALLLICIICLIVDGVKDRKERETRYIFNIQLAAEKDRIIEAASRDLDMDLEDAVLSKLCDVQGYDGVYSQYTLYVPSAGLFLVDTNPNGFVDVVAQLEVTNE